jgi:hypothetical protein
VEPRNNELSETLNAWNLGFPSLWQRGPSEARYGGGGGMVDCYERASPTTAYSSETVPVL